MNTNSSPLGEEERHRLGKAGLSFASWWATASRFNCWSGGKALGLSALAVPWKQCGHSDPVGSGRGHACFDPALWSLSAFASERTAAIRLAGDNAALLDSATSSAAPPCGPTHASPGWSEPAAGAWGCDGRLGERLRCVLRTMTRTRTATATSLPVSAPRGVVTGMT